MDATVERETTYLRTFLENTLTVVTQRGEGYVTVGLKSILVSARTKAICFNTSPMTGSCRHINEIYYHINHLNTS
jgi:hypothetical protein